MGKKGNSAGGGGIGCSRFMSGFMAPLCVQRPNIAGNQWMGGGGGGWGSMGQGWGGSMAGSGYYPGSLGFGANSQWPSYGGSGYVPTTPAYGSGYGSGYNPGYEMGTSNQWSPWSYGQGGWSNNWQMGSGGRKGKTNTQVDRQQLPPSKTNILNNSNENRVTTTSNLSNHNFSPRFPTKSVSSSQIRYPDKSSYNPKQSAYNHVPQSPYTPNNNPNSKYDDIIVQQEIM